MIKFCGLVNEIVANSSKLLVSTASLIISGILKDAHFTGSAASFACVAVIYLIIYAIEKYVNP